MYEDLLLCMVGLHVGDPNWCMRADTRLIVKIPTSCKLSQGRSSPS